MSNGPEPVVITGAGHEPVVVVSKRDYESLVETAYLLRSPANVRHLLASIAELEGGGTLGAPAGRPHRAALLSAAARPAAAGATVRTTTDARHRFKSVA